MLRRLEQTAGVTRPIALVSSDTRLEPGVFGIRKPALLSPRTINSVPGLVAGGPLGGLVAPGAAALPPPQAATTSDAATAATTSL